MLRRLGLADRSFGLCSPGAASRLKNSRARRQPEVGCDIGGPTEITLSEAGRRSRIELVPASPFLAAEMPCLVVGWAPVLARVPSTRYGTREAQPHLAGSGTGA